MSTPAVVATDLYFVYVKDSLCFYVGELEKASTLDKDNGLKNCK